MSGGEARRDASWTGRSLGSAFQHRLFYALIRLGGRQVAGFVLRIVVAWFVLFRPLVRRRTRPYLQRRFPHRNPFQRLVDAYRLCLAFGHVLVDRAALGILGPDRFPLQVEGREELVAALAEGHGLILLTAHVGGWQLGTAALTRLEVPVSALIHRDAGDVDRPYFEHGRGAPPYRAIEPAGYLGGLLEMLQVLKEGHVVCIMGDRLLGGPGGRVAVDFLGGTVHLPFSPYKLASATGAPIAVILTHRDAGGGYALRVDRVIRVPGDLGRAPSAFLPFAKQFVQSLEGFIRDHPYQFFNFYDLWTAPSGGS